jgi:dihydropyrimidinase
MSDRILILNGTIVTAEGQFEGDLLIKGEQVTALGQGFFPQPGDAVIDASGCFVMPGIIDPHTHIALDTGIYQTPDDFEIGTRTAACGGVTTVIDFATQFPGESLKAAVEARRAEAEGKACIDFALHCMVTDFPPSRERELAELAGLGVPSVKVYTTYRPNYYFDDDQLLRILRASVEAGVLVMVHAENDAMVTAATARLVAQQEVGLAHHGDARPALAEVEAVHRSLFLARQASAPVYVVHCSTSGAVELIRAARAAGQLAIAETCPQYLLLNADRYVSEHPEWFIMQPPLRGPAESAGLWQHLAAGAVDTVGTDHCDYTLAQKTQTFHFTDTPGGIPGLETLLPLVYTYAVDTGRIGIERLVWLLSTNPARVFGLYPRKGALVPGAEADLVLYDPRGTTTLSADKLHGISGYTPYAGMTVKGRVSMTLSRGQVVYRDGQFLGRPGHGRFVPGAPFNASRVILERR